MHLFKRLLSALLITREFEAEIANYGILKIDLASENYIKITDASRLSGYRHEGKDKHDPEFIEQTDSIEARIGLSFGIGFYFLVNNSHREVDLELTTRIRHPEMIHPITQQKAVSHTDTFTYTTPYYQYMHVTFEYEYELVKGLWTFEVWKEDRLVLEKRFTIL